MGDPGEVLARCHRGGRAGSSPPPPHSSTPPEDRSAARGRNVVRKEVKQVALYFFIKALPDENIMNS